MSPHERPVIDYYNTRESKHGYMLVLKGTKHFGYYKAGDKPWQFNKALRQMEERLADELALPAGSKVLDAGCGMGDVASYLASNYKLRIEGIDILDFNVAEAQSRVNERGLEEQVRFQVMNYSDLRFKDRTFDAVYTMETFVHATDPEQVLKEFYRVLKPGGKIVMFEYSRNPDSKISKRAAYMFREVNRLAAMPGFQQFNHGVQKRLMHEAGFENVKVQDITKNMLPMLWVFALIAYVPYKLLTLFRLKDKVVNSMSAVELWRYRNHFRYNIYTATKPK